MSVKRGAPVKREPVTLSSCRGCLVPPSMETILFVGGHIQCGACGIVDPCGLFGPMRPPEQLIAAWEAEHGRGEG